MVLYQFSSIQTIILLYLSVSVTGLLLINMSLQKMSDMHQSREEVFGSLSARKASCMLLRSKALPVTGACLKY